MSQQVLPLIVQCLKNEHSYPCRIEGKIPDDLRGTLYRNGPGIFERKGVRKNILIDGDGMIRSFEITDKGVFFRNKHIRTEKFVDEQKADCFQYATWSTKMPGILPNLFARNVKNQAGVSVLFRGGRLFAFDDGFMPYELNPETLETLGIAEDLKYREANICNFGAHSKYDPFKQQWIHFGINYVGIKMSIEIGCYNAQNKLLQYKRFYLPFSRKVFFHDFFMTEHYLVFNLHPYYLNFAPFLFGLKPVSESLEWKPDKGNVLMIIDRNFDKEPVFIDAPPRYMWHTLNAYEANGNIIGEFVGYAAPDNLSDTNNKFSAIVKGKDVKQTIKNPSYLYRYEIDVKAKKVKEHLICNHILEMPMINALKSCSKQRYGYFIKSDKEVALSSNLVRYDYFKDECIEYNEDLEVNCFEPIFAPRQGYNYSENGAEPGYVLTEYNNQHTGKAYLAIFDAEHIGDGPIAKAHLEHHLPIGFHGCWNPLN